MRFVRHEPSPGAWDQTWGTETSTGVSDASATADATTRACAPAAGHKPTGGKVEILLLRKLNDVTWIALIGGRNVRRVDVSPSHRDPRPVGGRR